MDENGSPPPAGGGWLRWPRWPRWPPRRLRRLLPWAAAAALLGGLFARLPREQVARALVAGPAGTLAAFAAVMAVLALLADTAATRTALARTGLRRPFRQLLLARGASYLLSLINPAAGMGGVGYYLVRTGAEPARAAAAVLLLLVTFLAAMATVGLGGMLAAGGAGELRPWLAPLGLLAAALAAGLAVLHLRPRWLSRRQPLAPLFAAGVGGFVAATAARVPHVLSLLLSLWGGLWLWGVALPAGRGTVLLSIVLLVSALPLTPAGLGTTEAALVLLAAPYAPGAGAPARQALVLAFCLLYHLFGLAAQAVLALLCLAMLPRSRQPLATAEPGAFPPKVTQVTAPK
jgi:uncharacterized membrane protein YbhN (UPF0104 family)